jgi:hypothetical protein
MTTIDSNRLRSVTGAESRPAEPPVHQNGGARDLYRGTHYDSRFVSPWYAR